MTACHPLSVCAALQMRTARGSYEREGARETDMPHYSKGLQPRNSGRSAGRNRRATAGQACRPLPTANRLFKELANQLIGLPVQPRRPSSEVPLLNSRPFGRPRDTVRARRYNFPFSEALPAHTAMRPKSDDGQEHAADRPEAKANHPGRVMLDHASMAQAALAILWGGTLCGIGYVAVLSIWSAHENRGAAIAGVVFTVTFIATFLLTLSVANVFDVIDWIWPGKHAI